MRVVRDPASGEQRDALAQDWARLFTALGSESRSWVMLPNVGDACASLAQSLGVNALVLSGGDDLGATPERDRTEEALLTWAAARNPACARHLPGHADVAAFLRRAGLPLSWQNGMSEPGTKLSGARNTRPAILRWSTPIINGGCFPSCCRRNWKVWLSALRTGQRGGPARPHPALAGSHVASGTGSRAASKGSGTDPPLPVLP